MENFAGTDIESLQDAYEMLKMGGQYEFSLWTTTEYYKKRAYTFNLINSNNSNISALSSYKKNGYSVRCVKNK